MSMKSIYIEVYVEGKPRFLKNISFSDVYLTHNAKEALILNDNMDDHVAATVLLRRHGYDSFKSLPVDRKAHILGIINETIRKNSNFTGVCYSVLSDNIYNLVKGWSNAEAPETYVAFTEKILPSILSLND